MEPIYFFAKFLTVNTLGL